jgi:peptidoglycan hydrolase-like protein with peptidoglycan-binding domain
MATRILLFVFLTVAAASLAGADDLTMVVQEDLQSLGYDVGAVDGELSTKTAIAISQFQAENNLDVTGEVTPQLVGTVKAAKRGKLSAAPAPAAAQPAPAAAAPADLKAMQQACIQKKMAKAQEKQKKKRGFGKLMSAVGRVAGRTSGAADIQQTAVDVYDANATAEDLAGAAEDLGLTEDDIEKCRNPEGAS